MRSMEAVRIVIVADVRQLSRQVTGISEECLVEKLAANGAGQPFDEGL